MSEEYWDLHWAKRTESKEATEFAIRMADRIKAFMSKYTVANLADFGCGPATTIFTLAQQLPDIQFTGFDHSQRVVDSNQAKVEEKGISNIQFKRDRLPNLVSMGFYDIVLCLSTLHYVADIEAALRSLYKRVNNGGHLILNYPSTFTQREYRRSLKLDNGEARERFRVLLEGGNLISQRGIYEVLGVRSRHFYSSKRFNVYVSIRK